MPATLTSTDPATGEPIDEVEITDAETVGAAIRTAKAAQPSWAERSLDERLDVLKRFQARLLDQRETLARLIAREAGKPVTEALVADVMPSLEMVAYLDRHGADVMRGERFRLANPLLLDRTSEVRREPLGTIGIIAPWNYPFSIPATQALQALFAGNAIVLKPSEHTPMVGARLVDLLQTAGVPEDVCQLVQGPGDPTGRALVESGVDTILFTGSVATGRKVSEGAGARGTPVVLELGGKDPMLVLDDANVELAAGGAVWGAFTNAGQTCSAVERVYVNERVADAFIEHVIQRTERLHVGPGLEDGTEVGPLITEDAVDRVEAQVEDAVKQGASIETGGKRLPELGPRFFTPTVITGVDHEMSVMTEETFGPLLPIQVVEDDEQAVQLANDSRYGLTASVWTTRKDRGRAIADRLDAGTVTINDAVYTYAACETPWGGVKDSGQGRTHGRWGLEEVTRVKHINHARAGRGRSAWYFPYDDDLARLGDEGLELLYGSKLEGLKVTRPFLRRYFGDGG